MKTTALLLAILLWAASAYSQSVSLDVRANGPPRPVVLLSFDENTGTVARDISGLGNDATFVGTGITWVPGKYGSAISLDGNGYLSIVHSNSLDLSVFTIEAEVKPTAALSTYQTVLASDYSYFLYASSDVSDCSNNAPLGGIAVRSGFEGLCAASALTLNQFRHVAVTYDGANLTTYIEGVQSSTAPALSGLPLETTSPITIGASSYGELFQGVIDNLRVYSYARTQAEIVADMNTAIALPVVGVPQVLIGSQGLRIGSQGIRVGGP